MMHKMRDFTKRIAAFALCFMMVLGSAGGVVYAEDASEKEVAIGYGEIETNRNGGLVTTYFPAYEMSAFAVAGAKETLKGRMIAALDAYEKQVAVDDLNFNCNSADDLAVIEEALSEVLNGEYKYFYANGGYGYGYYPDGSMPYIVIGYEAEFLNTDNSVNSELIKEKLSVLKERIDYALSFISEDMSDLEKALALHDYLVTVCDYDYENYESETIPAASYQIWGVLVNELAVCQGYAEAYSVLLKEVGIDSLLVTSDTMHHAWNLVYLDGYWYHVDVTWDDPVWPYDYTYYYEFNNDDADLGFVGHSYFLKSDEEFLNLEHRNWMALEEATKSRTYEDYVFAGTKSDKNFMYYNSNWYYIDAGVSSKLYKVKLDNPTGSYVTLEGDAYYYGEIDDVVYYAGEEAIYSYDLANGTNVKVVDVANEYPGYILCEFITRYDSLRAVLYNSASGAFKEISIPVMPANVAVTGVSLNKTSLSFTEAGATANLTATVAPSNATNKAVSWKSSNPSVATVSDSGVVTAVSNGTATITVTTEDGNYSATCTVTVEIPAPPVEPEPPVVTDPVEDFVERMYTVALNRPSDAAGKANWVYMLKANTHDGAGLAAEFILGAEFALRGLSDEEYVDVLYHTFFNREADQGGKDLWLAVLASGQTREYVLSNFVNLEEFTMLCASYGIERGVMLDNGTAVNPGIPQFVKRLYSIVLSRNADNQGLYNNVLVLVVRVETAESVAKNFFTSQEYLMKNKTTAEYVKDLYSVFMNREADQGGLDLWVSFIDQYGMTRNDVLSEFAKSDEFKAIAASYGLQ